MKKINILISSLLLITALVFVFQACQKQITNKKEEVSKQINSIELRDQDCIDPDVLRSCIHDWEPFTTVVYLPDYPDCPITLTGLTNYCPAQGGFKWVVKDLRVVSIPFLSPECSTLLSDIFDKISNSTLEEQEAFFNHLWNEAYDRYARNFIDYLVTQYPNEIVRCGNSIAAPVVEFYVESCYKVCVCPSVNDNDPWSITKNPCGNGCCMRSYEWCLDDNDEIKIEKTVTPLSNCTQIYETDCNLFTCFETQCLMWCNL